MRRRKQRIGVWLVISILLILFAGYLYLNRSNTGIGKIENSGASQPKNLVYLKTTDKIQQIISRNLDNDKEVLLMDNTFDQLLSVSPDKDTGVVILLIKKDDRVRLVTLGLVNGSSTLLADLTDFKVSKAIELADGKFALVCGDKKDSVVILDTSYQKETEIKIGSDVSALYFPSDKEMLVSAFDGSNSKIEDFNLSTQEHKDVATLEGVVYKFDQEKALYAKKITATDAGVENPVEKTYWKIALKNLNDLSETIISDGNFDQNAISDNNFNFIAYQKKYDTADVEDGRIFLVDGQSHKDRAGQGLPLIFSY